MGERNLTDADIEALSKAISASLIATLMKEETAEAISSVWSSHVDRWIGRGLRRMAIYILLVILLAGAIKWEVVKFAFLK